MTSVLFSAIFILSFFSGFLTGAFVFPIEKNHKKSFVEKKEKGIRELNAEYLKFINYDGTEQP